MDIQHNTEVPKKKLIALIDDDEAVLFSVRGLLEADGRYAVRYFESPEQFIERARPEEFGCILLDYMFSPDGMDGMDMLRYLAKCNCQTPIVMVTTGDKANLFNTFDMGGLGAKALLLKPFVYSELRDSLRKAMLSVGDQAMTASRPASAEPDPENWETGNLDDLVDALARNHQTLDKEGHKLLLNRAKTKLTADEYGKFEKLTVAQMKVFFIRSKLSHQDKILAPMLKLTKAGLDAHNQDIRKKLGTISRQDWYALFYDKLK
jgi:FixJ family two-component response regulator